MNKYNQYQHINRMLSELIAKATAAQRELWRMFEMDMQGEMQETAGKVMRCNSMSMESGWNSACGMCGDEDHAMDQAYSSYDDSSETDGQATETDDDLCMQQRSQSSGIDS